MMIELRLQAAASVTPVRAMSCTRAEQREEACASRAEGENGGREDDLSELKLQAAGVPPVRAMSCARAEQREGRGRQRRRSRFAPLPTRGGHRVRRRLRR